MSLASLPLELYAAILDHIDGGSVQSSILSLTRAIPHAPIPLERFFERIVLRSTEQVVQLQRRLRDGKAEALHVRELRIESWTADPQVIINLLVLLDNLTTFALFVGPNFDPDGLLEIFKRPQKCLQSLSLRFKPYVQRANYYHFLKGAYFDPIISALAGWPPSPLHALSIVQDPLDSGRERACFAQPLVFFSFQPLLALSTSPLSQNLHSLRIRIPGRDVGPYLAVAPRAFPALRVLDLSTGNVRSNQLDRILSRFDQVQHVRLDACALASGREPEEWAAIGKDCALIGARRARERERALKAWKEELEMEVVQRREMGQEQHGDEQDRVAASSRVKAGRKGLAMAKISLRGASLPLALPTSSSTAVSITPPELDPSILASKIRVLPFPPSLLTLTTTILPLPPSPISVAPPLLNDPDPETQEERMYTPFQEAFAEGWTAGINQLRQTWRRLRVSSSSSVSNSRVMYLVPGAPHDGSGLDGLEDVDEEKWDSLERADYPAPIVCFAGECESGVLDGTHPEGCGHSVTELAWGDPRFLRTK